MTFSDILTPRLRLTAMTAPMLQADAQTSSELGQLLRAEVPPCWPPENWEPHVFAFIQEQMLASPQLASWNRYLVLRDEPEVLIGNMNGFWSSANEAEIGYAVLPRWQRAGLATEALQAFLGMLFAEGTLSSVTAHTFSWLAPSIRVLQKCHFAFDGAGDEGGTIRFRLERTSFEKQSPRAIT